MVIVNDTDQDARVRVAGRGSDVAPDDRLSENEENAANWPVIPSYSLIRPKALSSGPWTVQFVINGRRIVREVRSESSVVKLTLTGHTFTAKVD